MDNKLPPTKRVLLQTLRRAIEVIPSKWIESEPPDEKKSSPIDTLNELLRPDTFENCLLRHILDNNTEGNNVNLDTINPYINGEPLNMYFKLFERLYNLYMDMDDNDKLDIIENFKIIKQHKFFNKLQFIKKTKHIKKTEGLSKVLSKILSEIEPQYIMKTNELSKINFPWGELFYSQCLMCEENIKNAKSALSSIFELQSIRVRFDFNSKYSEQGVIKRSDEYIHKTAFIDNLKIDAHNNNKSSPRYKFHWILLVPCSFSLYKKYIKPNIYTSSFLKKTLKNSLVFDSDFNGRRFVNGTDWLKKSKIKWESYYFSNDTPGWDTDTDTDTDTDMDMDTNEHGHGHGYEHGYGHR